MAKSLGNCTLGHRVLMVAVALALPECAIASTQYIVVDTGQTQCYDDGDEIAAPASGEAYYGQDAQYEGNQPSYTLSGDGLTGIETHQGEQHGHDRNPVVRRFVPSLGHVGPANVCSTLLL